MVHVMVVKCVATVLKIVVVVQWNPHVAMANVMVQKTVIHVVLTVVLVAHSHQPVATDNVMEMRIARHVLKIVAPI